MKAWIFTLLMLIGATMAQQPQTQQLLTEAQQLAQQARQSNVAASPDASLWKQAIGKAEEATKLEPASPSAWQLLAQLYTETKFWIRAEEAWNQFIKLKGTTALADAEVAKQAALTQLNLGYTAYQRGDYDVAVAKFRNAAEYTPQDAQAFQWLGRIYLEQGNVAAAREQWQKANTLRPDATNRYFLSLSQDSNNYGTKAVRNFYTGYDAYTAGRRAEALEAFAAASQAAPSWLEAKRWVARTHLELGNLQPALQMWQEISKSPQANASDRYQLRVAELSAQHGLQAAKAFLQGVAQFQAGDRAAALTSFRAAVTANASFASAWYWLGRTAFETKDYAQAEQAYMNVLTLEPSNKDAQYWLNQTRRALGR